MEALYQSTRLILGGSETIKITGQFPCGADTPSTHLLLQFSRLADAVTRSDFELMSEQVAVCSVWLKDTWLLMGSAACHGDQTCDL